MTALLVVRASYRVEKADATATEHSLGDPGTCVLVQIRHSQLWIHSMLANDAIETLALGFPHEISDRQNAVSWS